MFWFGNAVISLTAVAALCAVMSGIVQDGRDEVYCSRLGFFCEYAPVCAQNRPVVVAWLSQTRL